MKNLSVFSEVAPLKKVCLHRPGLELENLTPKWLNDLLFDDIPWLKKAQIEHDYLASVLKENGVEVVYLVDLVEESLQNQSVKKQFIDQFIKESNLIHHRSKEKIYTHLNQMTTRDMILTTMAGIVKADFQTYRKHSLKDHIRDYPFMTDPMPNLYFTRDPFSTVFNTVSLNKMYKQARARETIYGEYIFKYHPEYKQTVKVYDRHEDYSIEGGDIMVLNSKVLAVGISERSEPDGIEKFAQNVFDNTDAEVVLAIDLPKKRSFMHLDTVLTQVDVDKFLIHHDFTGNLNVYEIYRGSRAHSLRIIPKKYSIKRLFSYHLKTKITVIPCGGDDKITSDREQWNDGANALAIAPGVVIVYERNQVTNQILQEHGVKTIVIPASELSRGRGGPRCMSMPLIRK
ncbi:arginine deiminase [Mariniplasma anaerobium]|uniref:Arginine deiminase n=1 Tax=Mariniplasma anaerobium TaxID=2735436 RepID=A0A7U9TIL5_9MOLU|nr:arginine deiminase [Mariniplasma anaerobium]BCR36480.1 arginine deiminase [Mariniplasma anaerobium]